MLRRGNQAEGEERDYLELSFAGRRQDLRPGRADRPDLALLGRASSPQLSQARRHRVAADEAARPQGRHRPRRGAARAVRRRAPTRRGHAFAPDTPWQARDGGELPVRGDARPAAGRRRGQARHGGRPADGPARRRRRRLRQDRGRAAGRVQGDPGRQAGRGPRPDDGPRGAALRDVRPALRGVPGQGPAAVAVRRRRPSRRRRSAGLADGSVDLVIGTHRLLSQGRPVPRPRARRRRRGAAVRRRGQGAAQAAPARGRRPDAVAPRRSRGRSTWPSPASAT